MRVGVITVSDGQAAFAQGRSLHELQHVADGDFAANPPDGIVLAAATGRTVVYDCRFPAPLKGHLREIALAAKLEEFLPIPIQDVVWLYRERQPEEYQLCAVHRDEFDRLMRLAAERGLRCDQFIPAQMLDHGVVPEKVTSVSATIPPELRPVRFRACKTAYVVLLVLAATIVALLYGNQYRHFRREYAALQQHREALQSELRTQRRNASRLHAEQELLTQLQEAKVGVRNALPVLAELTELLPKHMWIEHWNQRQEQFDLVVHSSRDDAALYRILSQSKTFQLLNLRKSKQGAETIVYTLKLRSQASS